MPVVQTNFKRMYLVSNKPKIESPPPVIVEAATNDSDPPSSKPEQNNYICPQCGFSFISQQTLDEHIKTSHKSKLFQCEKCDFSTDNLELYKTHFESEHQGIKRKSMDDNDNDSQSKKLNLNESCETCGNNGEDLVVENKDKPAAAVVRKTLKDRKKKIIPPTYMPYNSQRLSRTKRDNDVIGRKLQQMENANLKRTVAKKNPYGDLSDIEDDEKDQDYRP